MSSRLNTAELVYAVAKKSGIVVDDVHLVLLALRDVVARELAAGNSVAVTNFGTWRAKDLPARKRRNPKTGEYFMGDGHRAVRWTTSPRLAAIVRAKDTTATTRKRPSGPHSQNASSQQDA